MRGTLSSRLVPCLALLCMSCAPGPSSGNTPQEMFEYLIERPVPSEVTNLQGVGDTWQGYSIWLRFNATDDYMKSLITKGFTSVPCDNVQSDFALPEHYDRFDPPWMPVFTQCYEGEIASTWGNGYHILGIDDASHTVYFYGTAP